MTLVKQNRYIPPDHYARIKRRLLPTDAALCDLLRLTGFRVDDVLHTQVWQWRRPVITLEERKTGNVRSVPKTAAVEDALQRLMGTRYPLGADPLVPGLRGRPTDSPFRHRSTVWRRFTAAVKAAGLDGHGYTIHSLRKMYAVEKYDQTQSLLAVQRDLGHKKIETTLWYVCGSDISL